MHSLLFLWNDDDVDDSLDSSSIGRGFSAQCNMHNGSANIWGESSLGPEYLVPRQKM